jgi:choline kinase
MHAIIPAAGVGRRLGASAHGGPKSLIDINDRPLLLHTAQLLAVRKVQRLTVIVGYQAERFEQVLGSAIGGMAVDYALTDHYQSTEHGHSVYCARQAWRESEMPVLFLDADNAFAEPLLDRPLGTTHADSVLVDAALRGGTRDEELVLGANALVSGFVRGHGAEFENCVDGFVGMNRFTAGYVRELFCFMDTLFRAPAAPNHLKLKYERVFHRLAQEPNVRPRYLHTAGLDCVNINHPHDLARAAAVLANKM